MEDYESEDDEQENGTPTIVDKNFNFDMLRDARPAINRIKPPDFNDLTYVPVNPRIESHLVGRAHYKKSNPAQSVILTHHWKYYYCTCVEYDNPLPTPERIMNTCTINPIQTGEQIFVVSFYINKRLGTTSSQRWRRDCWEKLRPVLERDWIDYSTAKKAVETAEYFSLHSVIDESGNVVTEAAKRSGRPVSQQVLDLSDEDAVYRTKLTRQHATYMARYRKQPTAALVVLLNNLYETVDLLGGVPSGWEKYAQL